MHMIKKGQMTLEPGYEAALRPNNATPWPPNLHIDRGICLFMPCQAKFATKPKRDILLLS